MHVLYKNEIKKEVRKGTHSVTIAVCSQDLTFNFFEWAGDVVFTWVSDFCDLGNVSLESNKEQPALT
jgi:hypothetical protein